LGHPNARHLCDHSKQVESLRVVVALTNRTLLVLKNELYSISGSVQEGAGRAGIKERIDRAAGMARAALAEVVSGSPTAHELEKHVVAALEWAAKVSCNKISCRTGNLCGPCHARLTLEWIND